MTNRRIRVRMNGCLSDETSIQNGIPQGAVLSTTLFLIAINEVTQLIPSPIKILLYADDITITCSGKNLNTTQEMIQETLKKINNWANRSGFKLSKSKSQYTIFNKLRKPTKNFKITLENTPLRRAHTLKILGCYFDEKLTWKTHIKLLKAECLKRVNIIKMISSLNWGANKIIVINTYRSLIRSKIDYGSVIYSSAKDKVLDSLSPIHNSCLRMAIGAFRTSPISSILAESNEEPLSFRREKLSISYALKVTSNPKNPINKIIFDHKYFTNFHKQPSYPKPISLQIHNILSRTIPNLPPIYQYKSLPEPLELLHVPSIDTTLTKFLKQTTNPIIYRSLFYETLNRYENSIHIYTDGSKSATGTGCAIIYPDETKLIKLPDMSSVFYSEVYAIRSALADILKSNNSHFTIFTDSRSAIESIQNKHTKEPICLDIISMNSQIISSGKTLTYVWIPSHVNISGNETADTAAKTASSLPDASTHQASHNDIIKIIKRNIKENWNNQWLKSKPTQLHQIRDSIFELQPTCGTDRRLETVITRLRIGHSRLTHSHLITKTQPSTCNFCNSPYSIRHLIMECTNTNDRRKVLKLTYDFKYNLNSTETIKNIILLLKETNVYKMI